MRASGGAAVGVVTKGVDVHTTLSVGIVTSDVPRDGGVGRLGSLLKGDGAGDLGVTTEDSNYQISVSVSIRWCLGDVCKEDGKNWGRGLIIGSNLVDDIA